MENVLEHYFYSIQQFTHVVFSSRHRDRLCDEERGRELGVFNQSLSAPPSHQSYLKFFLSRAVEIETIFVCVTITFVLNSIAESIVCDVLPVNDQNHCLTHMWIEEKKNVIFPSATCLPCRHTVGRANNRKINSQDSWTDAFVGFHHQGRIQFVVWQLINQMFRRAIQRPEHWFG